MTLVAVQVLRPGLVKGPWTKEEDDKIVECIRQGIVKWSEIAARIPGRIGKQCRERWCVYLVFFLLAWQSQFEFLVGRFLGALRRAAGTTT
jgi:hypothetical protein